MIRHSVKPVTVLVALLALLPFAGAACRSPSATGEDPEEEVLLAYIANAGANHVQVVDTESGETVRKIYSGITPWRLVPAPDGRELWVQHWSSETTAVVSLDDHEVRATLPLRGPGIFDPAGDSFLSFSWPSSELSILDSRSLETVDTRVTEVSRVYDFITDAAGENLFLVQYDPLSRGHRQRYAYLVSLPLAAAVPSPSSVSTGHSPVEVLAVPGHPFLLTADSESGSVTLLNIHGDGRTVSVCPGPRRLLLGPGAERLVVLCWDSDAGRHGHAVSYRTDFGARPWPQLTEEAAVEIDAGLVAGVFAPGGESVWVVDQPGERLLELDARRLTVRREIATGAVPADVALLAVPASWRRRLEEPGPGRRRAEAALARARGAGAPFEHLRWTEAVTWDGPAGEETATGGDAEPPLQVTHRQRRIDMALAAPDRLRRQASEEAVSLAADGWSLTVRADGRFWTTPHQELAGRVYALSNFEPAEALQRLAGDLSGSPFLAGGLALDLSAEVTEDGRRYVLIGALEPGQPVAQLWLDAETGRPAHLIEKFPGAPASGHEEAPVGRFVETAFHEFVTLPGGVVMPSRLTRLLDGRWEQEVRLENLEVAPPPAAEIFDLARLGGFGRWERALRTAEPSQGAAHAGPGRAVPVVEHGYLASPWAEHPPYSSHPPTSGPRLRALADWGVHAIPVPPELLLHNLEHGGVAVQYNCPEGCPELVAQLERWTAAYSAVILAPDPSLESRLALSAWGRFDTLEDADEARVVAFFEAWEGQDHHTASETAP